MPTYCFSSKKGKTIEREFSMAHIPERIYSGREVYERDLVAEHSDQKSGDCWTNHYSLGLGARTPRHAREIAAKCKRAGLSCDFDAHLRMRVTSKEHQRKLIPVVLGKDYHNRDAYCG